MKKLRTAILIFSLLVASTLTTIAGSAPASAAAQNLVYDCYSSTAVTIYVAAGDSLSFSSNCNGGGATINNTDLLSIAGGQYFWGGVAVVVNVSGTATDGTYNDALQLWASSTTHYNVIIGGVAPPTISSISPSSGGYGEGTLITITGTGFAAGAAVTVGGVACLNISVTPTTSISCNAPLIDPGIKDVVVTNTDTGTVTSTGGFTVNAPISTPTISSISQNKGSTKGGTRLTITGTGFDNAASVTVGGTSATIISRNGSTAITVRTPAHTKGTVSVVVTNPDTGFATFNSFTYVKGEDSKERDSRERD